MSNYAQDAIWWRLTNPTVRDLASLLTAPALWKSGCELPVSQLLGKDGFRYLLMLNDEPHRLPENLIAPRLGHYAENLLLFWFQNAPHSELFAHNLIITHPHTQQQKGALDFLVSLNQTLYHLELTCKYYGAPTGQPEMMRGFCPKDTLLCKQNKLIEQLNLSQSLNLQTLCPKVNTAQTVNRASIIRGVGFTHSGSLNNSGCLKTHALYPDNAWQGTLITNPAQWPSFQADARFYVFSRQEYLAPARVLPQKTQSFDSIFQMKNAIVAHVLPRSDGYWHETERFMLLDNSPT